MIKRVISSATFRWRRIRDRLHDVNHRVAVLRGADPYGTSLEQDMAALIKRFPIPPEATNARPIFVFSVGWRSGSTALQRLLMSSKQAIIWGEPYESEGVYQGMAEALRAAAHTPGDKNSFEKDLESVDSLADKWVATYVPPIADLVEAHRAFLLRFLGNRPEYADLRWGMKTVRLTPEYASYFKLLFPASDIIILMRNPYDAYASFHGRRWLRRAPDDYVHSPQDFARHWVECAASAHAIAESTGALVLRYEDLGTDETARAVQQATGLDVDPSTLKRKVGSTAKTYATLPSKHRRQFERTLGDYAQEQGYELPQ